METGSSRTFLVLCLLASVWANDLTCEEDLEEVGGVKCKNIPQNLAGLNDIDLSPFGTISKMKLILADEARDPSTTDDHVEAELKLFLDNLSSSLLELFFIRFNGLLTNTALRNLQHLTTLTIVKSDLPSLPDYLFAGLGNLTSVMIKEASFDTINQLVFADDTQKKSVSPIKKLKFESCNINSITDKSLFHLKDLEILDLSHNNINSIISDFLKWLLKLKKIDLSQNSISNLDEDVFKFNKQLKEIDLNNNDLTVLPCMLFKWQIQLKTLNLTGNALTDIQCHMAQRQNRHLEKLDMTGNPLPLPYAQLLEHPTRGVNFKLNKKFLKIQEKHGNVTEDGKVRDLAGKLKADVCQICESALPPRRKLKMRIDEFIMDKEDKWSSDGEQNGNGL